MMYIVQSVGKEEEKRDGGKKRKRGRYHPVIHESIPNAVVPLLNPCSDQRIVYHIQSKQFRLVVLCIHKGTEGGERTVVRTMR